MLRRLNRNDQHPETPPLNHGPSAILNNGEHTINVSVVLCISCFHCKYLLCNRQAVEQSGWKHQDSFCTSSWSPCHRHRASAGAGPRHLPGPWPLCNSAEWRLCTTNRHKFHCIIMPLLNKFCSVLLYSILFYSRTRITCTDPPVHVSNILQSKHRGSDLPLLTSPTACG